MKIIVIGHGMVGHKLVECLAQDAAHGLDITVLCEESRPAYDRVHLSEFFSGKTADDLSLVEPGFFERQNVRLLLNALETVPQQKVLDSLRLFAKEVMPHFQGASDTAYAATGGR